MKYLILVCGLILGTFAHAERTTDSIRTSSGDLVRIGDNHKSVVEKLEVGRPKHYVLDDGKYYCAATEYVTSIYSQEYTVILCGGKVVKITWRNL